MGLGADRILEEMRGLLDVEGIMGIIPHRPPFLFVDSIVELEEGKRARGVKHVRADEQFFRGHFPGRPVMPGVLLVEAMAQVGAVALLSCPTHRGKIAYFAGIDGARFRKPVVPGDTLEMDVELVKVRSGIGKGRGRATVGGALVAEAELMFALGAAGGGA